MQEAKKGSWATAAGEDYAEIWRGGVAAGREVEGCYGAGLEERGDGHGGGGFDDDFYAPGGDETSGVCWCKAKGWAPHRLIA